MEITKTYRIRYTTRSHSTAQKVVTATSDAAAREMAPKGHLHIQRLAEIDPQTKQEIRWVP